MNRALVTWVVMTGCAGGPINPELDAEDVVVVPDCRIEADDAIDAAELPIVPGLTARYTRNAVDTAVSFAVDGAVDEDGMIRWDFSEGPDDVGATFETLDPGEAWFADVFPAADFASPLLVETPELVGVYRFDEVAGELLLLGVTTAVDQPPARRTLVIYDEPVLALRLPLVQGATWGQQATFRDAVIAGVPNAGVEDWVFEVDAAGSVDLPGGIGVEQVLRVRSSVRRTTAVSLGQPTTELHKLVWMAPCFGELASVVSSDAISDTVDELRRYLP